MPDIASVSPNSIKNRRQTLKNQRRWKFWQSIWRLLAVGSLAGGAFWLLLLPYWSLRDKTQVKIVGNRLLSAEQIRSLLPLSYPQALWKLPAQQLSDRLEAAAPIVDAQLTRQLFPPTLTVAVRERQPVATAPTVRGAGFLDAAGVWIPQSFYRQAGKDWKRPTLQVLGFEAAYRPYWQQMYPLLAHSGVKISAVDWRNPQNLILKTELGTVHCGAYTPDFPQKLARLSQMRQLPARVPLNRLTYIDLTNPTAPTLAVKPQKTEKPTVPNVKKQ
jgi:cell division protein FtsQ